MGARAYHATQVAANPDNPAKELSRNAWNADLTLVNVPGTDVANTFALTQTFSAITLGGNISSPAWTTAGLRIKGIAATLTDTTSTGTVAAAYTDSFGGNTIAASNATTFTNYVTAYFKEGIAGVNVTLTNKWALGADSLRIGSTGQFSVTNAGVATFAVAPTFTDAAGTRTALGLGTLATQSGTFSGSSSGANTGDQTITLTGDVTGTGTGSFASTLATVLATPGVYTSANITVDAKGRVTAAASGSGGGASLSAANTWTAQNTFAAGAITASAPMTFTQTWNNSAVTFVGLFANYTSTASAAGSLFADLQLGGVSKFSIKKDGLVTCTGLDMIPGLAGYGLQFGGAGGLQVRSSATTVFYMQYSGVFAILNRSDGMFGWSSTTNPEGTRDTGLSRNAAGVVEVNTGTAGTRADLFARNVRTEAKTVATLTAAATAGSGARSFVTDALTPTFGATVAAGGAVATPVYSDGTNWKVG